MINRKIILMTLFSFAAHVAVAAVIVYNPYNMSGNTIADHHDTVIWGYVASHSEPVSGSQMMKGQEILKQVQNDVTDDRNHDIEAVYSDETPISRRSTKDDDNNPPTPPFKKGGKGGFDLTEGQKGKTGVISVPSDGSDTGDKKLCNSSEDCESVSQSDGNQGGNRFDKHALADYVRKEIEKYKYYPDIAKLRWIEGTVYINFYINHEGIPSSISVARSSGSGILDEAGVKTVGLVGKISDLHKDLEGLDIVVPITYKLGK